MEGWYYRSVHSTDGIQNTLVLQNSQEPLLDSRSFEVLRPGRHLKPEHFHYHVVEVCHGVHSREQVLPIEFHEHIEGFHSHDLPTLRGHIFGDGVKQSENTDSRVEETRQEEPGGFFLFI